MLLRRVARPTRHKGRIVDCSKGHCGQQPLTGCQQRAMPDQLGTPACRATYPPPEAKVLSTVLCCSAAGQFPQSLSQPNHPRPPKVPDPRPSNHPAPLARYPLPAIAQRPSLCWSLSHTQLRAVTMAALLSRIAMIRPQALHRAQAAPSCRLAAAPVAAAAPRCSRVAQAHVLRSSSLQGGVQLPAKQTRQLASSGRRQVAVQARGGGNSEGVAVPDRVVAALPYREYLIWGLPAKCPAMCPDRCPA